jgi:hypothetical protein
MRFGYASISVAQKAAAFQTNKDFHQYLVDAF